MGRDLDEPDIDLSRGRAYEVLERLGDLGDPRQASIPNFPYVHAQAHQRFTDFANLADGMTVSERESDARFNCYR